jgi:uncharacterized membrane protein YhaH (DUF805 family)
VSAALRRGLAFWLGVVAAGTIHDAALRLLSLPGGDLERAGTGVAGALLMSAVTLPGATLAFRRFEGSRLSGYQAALIGAAYWTFLAAFQKMGWLGAGGMAGGVAVLVVGPFLVAWAGCALLARGQGLD